MNIKRVFLIVADSLGIGAADDADKFYNGGGTDVGSDTFGALVDHDGFDAPFLKKLGIGNIDGVDYPETDKPLGAYAVLKEKSAGKDTVTGHWELCGVVTDKPMPTFPSGFPEDFMDEFSRRVGRGYLCNMTYSGTEVLKDYGREHVETGRLIVYTSSDSVFQIAAHEDVVTLEELYRCCEIAREMLSGDMAVGRVIARPFVGEYPDYKRTANRHDYALASPSKTLCDVLIADGYKVIGVGKIGDIFAHRGITEEIHTQSNADGIEKTIDLLDRDFNGLCFVNLVDFDSVYGHRRNVSGYAEAVMYFDSKLEEIAGLLGDDDVLIVTADHGCDPSHIGTDHTRENVPLLIYGKQIKRVNIGTRYSFADLGKTIADMFSVKSDSISGESFLNMII